MRPLGAFLRDVMKANKSNFRVFGLDENTCHTMVFHRRKDD
jgi:xylulose-5-phosphate/fructose-6-phosphate phosphoketolase